MAFRLINPDVRKRAARAVMAAPDGYMVVIKDPTRTQAQNSKMWAMLEDVSRSEMLGKKYTPEQWKRVFMSACGWEVQFLEGLSGEIFPSGFKSSRMTTKQMVDMITYIEAEGNRSGVKWTFKQDGW